MSKFKKFNAQEHIRGLAEAALQVLAEEMGEQAIPTHTPVVDVIEERNLQVCLKFFKAKVEE